MSQRYENRFKALSKQDRKAFIPFTLLGWPDDDQCLKSIETMIASGVSCLELGFPFSDPVADGPIIQRAAYQALSNGFTTGRGFDLLKRVRAVDADIPIGLLVYYNIVIAAGTDAFFAKCRAADVDAVLIADLPVENVDEVKAAAEAHQIELIFLVSPVTTPARLDLICNSAGAFIYLISRLGVTGTGERDAQKDAVLSQIIASVRERTKTPICAGFGISSPDQARAILSLGADGVITGSRVVELLQNAAPENAQTELARFCKQMLDVCTKSGANVS